MKEFFKNVVSKQMNIFSKDIHIWGIDLSDHLHKIENLYNLLSSDERKRASDYRFEKDQNTYIIVRGILRNIISYYLSVDPNEIEFLYNSYGKPYIKNQNSPRILYFNVSHSGDLALCIIAMNREVGVDVEKVHSLDDHEEIAKQYFSPNEYLNLKSISKEHRLNFFFKCWTRKEAFIKAIGNGLSYPLNEFTVLLESNKSALLSDVSGDTQLLTTEWVLKPINLCHGYEAAFAFKGRYRKIEYWRYRF